MRLAYLFSRYPIVSQTFCDTEMLALEKMGIALEIHSIYPPPTSFRHGHAARLKAPIHYAPDAPILKLAEAAAKKSGRWPARLVADHERRYGPAYKAELRARNALHFADLFAARGITHFHVHFANRAAHTAIFVKAISGIPFSVSTHGQDFMVDLGNDELLGEICREAEFIANETEFSKSLVAQRAPASVGKMLRVFNGMDLSNFPAPTTGTANPVPRIVSIGRLIEFKGFHHLIAACAKLRWRGLPFLCEIIGEGPWRERLQAQIDELDLDGHVRLTGALPQEEVFTALRSCDIFALACIVDKAGASDVFPTVILEAMASAKPVVSTVLAGVPEAVKHEDTGLLVPPGDEPALAEALARLVASSDLRQRYGQAGRERIETEFAVEKTVQPLRALFEKHVKPSVAPPRPRAGWACLVEAWPASDQTESELRQLADANPALPIYAARASGLPAPVQTERVSARLAFLPDGMVLEAEWQRERELARQIEIWRADFGQKLLSEYFLQQARHALFLRHWIERDGVRHLHAMSTRELLCGWILHRLTGITLSVTIDERTDPIPASEIVKLARGCAGIRFTKTDAEWAEELQKAPSSPAQFLHRAKRGRPLEMEWIGRLQEWGQTS